MRSILLHVYDDTAFESRLAVALDLARCMDGHLTCLHATPFEDYLATDPWVAARLPEEFSDKMKRLRVALQEKVESRLRSEGASWDWLHRDEQMATALIRYSILSDLVVVSLAGPAVERHEPRPLAAAVASAGRAPVLAVPEDVGSIRLDSPALVAWNGSPESAAAMRAAVPLLRRASGVHLLEIEEKIAHYPHDLAARYLSRHDIAVEIVQRRPLQGHISETLKAAVVEFGAEYVVMGAYGHSRLRESLLGGVTRDLTAASKVPLLLAH